MLGKEAFEEIRTWMYQHARNVELCLWQYLFEQGSKEAVVKALEFYQNEDGGFGHALEADCWNPESSPITTCTAIHMLQTISFFDLEHPIYQGILRYLHSKKGLDEYGWQFTIPSHDNYPHAPWWNYNEEENKKEYYGVSAELSAFVLKNCDRSDWLYERCLGISEHLLDQIAEQEKFGDMGIQGFLRLCAVMKELGLFTEKLPMVEKRLHSLVNESIVRDPKQWEFYAVRPSNYIHGPQSPFYEENQEIVAKELKYLVDTKPSQDVWGITWTWFENNERYAKEFAISEVWWEGVRVIEAIQYLKAFGQVEE